MKKIAPLLILIVLITFISCSKKQDVLIVENEDEQIVKTNNTEDSTDEEAIPPTEENCSDDLSNPVIFRVINELDVPVENVWVAGLKFGSLKPNETSCYLSTQAVQNAFVNEFWLEVSIDDKRYNSVCMWFCGMPPYDVYNYTSGKMTMKIVSFEQGEYSDNCLSVIEEVEEELIFTKEVAN